MHKIILSAALLSALPLAGLALAQPDGSGNMPLGTEKSFTLLLRAPEPRIVNGEVQVHIIAKRYDLPRDLIDRSFRIGRLSTLLDPHLEEVFAKIDDREPEAARFVNVGGQWEARQTTGWKVDREATRAALERAIQQNRPEAEVSVELKQPWRTVRHLAGQGIVELVETGESDFSGSPEFREENIVVGSSKIDGLVLADGDEFDFGEVVGPIDEEHGFVPGYIISGKELELEDGGGICQVSTTIFRAAYEAGLPITERHQHSYRVHYYDPPGYEATVYLPYKNLRWVNDTGNSMLVQAEWDREKQTLAFHLFGTKTNREVKITDPHVISTGPVGETTYVTDPDVKVGEERLVDPAEEAMEVVIYREVTLPDGTVREDSIRSDYVPWGATYAVNPEDPRAPEESAASGN